MDFNKFEREVMHSKFKRISQMVCKLTNLNPELMYNNMARGNDALAKYLAIYLCYEYTKAEYKDVAKFFGVTNPTINNASREIRKAIESGDQTKKWLRIVAKKIIERI